MALQLAQPFQTSNRQISEALSSSTMLGFVNMEWSFKYMHSTYKNFAVVTLLSTAQRVSPFWHFSLLLSLSKIMCSAENSELL